MRLSRLYRLFVLYRCGRTGLELVAASEGVFMASAAAIRSCASRDGICTYALPESYTDRQIYAACNRHHELSDICMKMISLLQED